MQRKHGGNLRLKEKLKVAASNIAVDILGIEKKVNANIMTYVQYISGEINVPKEQILLRIFKDGTTVRTGIYSKGSLVKEIQVAQLITIFINAEEGVFALEQKVLMGIRSFIEAIADSHQIPSEWIQICITTKEHQVLVSVYDRTTFLENISLKILIKYFS